MKLEIIFKNNKTGIWVNLINEDDGIVEYGYNHPDRPHYFKEKEEFKKEFTFVSSNWEEYQESMNELFKGLK